jgi:hypothetical protein
MRRRTSESATRAPDSEGTSPDGHPAKRSRVTLEEVPDEGDALSSSQGVAVVSKAVSSFSYTIFVISSSLSYLTISI